MIAREWKARCPQNHSVGFINYLNKTGIKDASSTPGFIAAQIFTRELNDRVEVTLISYWESLDSVKAFAGDDISVARLYPEDYQYELEADDFVVHYEVVKNLW